MSADFRTGHYKGYLHGGPGSRAGGEPYVHVTQAVSGSDYAIGDFTLGEVGELVQMAGQAWPDGPGVKVRYVIEYRAGYDGTGSNPHPWVAAWSAAADEMWEAGVPEDYAQAAFGGMASGRMEWRLVRRTTVDADEVLQPQSDGTA